MPKDRTQPFVCVGAVLEKEGMIALVREVKKDPDNGTWNLPSGWLELGEDPIAGARREAEEETGYKVAITHFLGVYSLVRKDLEQIYGLSPHPVQLIFAGTVKTTDRKLADDVSESKFFSHNEIAKLKLRNIDIPRILEDYFSGRRLSLDNVRHATQKSR